ncbi:MAG: MaoC family dehydratase [Rhodospirillales bacterium]|nr:MaoC family dehydratase [Rhodospirillales bacterium]
MAADHRPRGESDSAMTSKTNPGNFFEDFTLGRKIKHATPRTLSRGDASLYTALYGMRFALPSSDAFAQAMGFSQSPLDDLLVFHTVFGKSVPDISLNAVANLGYAAGRFGVPVFPGDTLSTVSEVIGLKENSNRKTGNVYVRSVGANQRGETVLDYVRWVMVRKRDPEAAVGAPVIPDLPQAVAVADLSVPEGLTLSRYDPGLAGGPHLWDDYAVGERIDHVDAMTLEESDHMTAARLYQNTAKVHFNQHTQKEEPLGRRIVYGGHIISLARALSFNGLANAFKIAAINGGRHVAPAVAGDTVYAWSEVLEKSALPGRNDIGALRLRTLAAKDRACRDFPDKDGDGKYDPAVLLDFDYTVLMPRRKETP